jgi:peptide-methionine (S)-S-oxide reductase
MKGVIRTRVGYAGGTKKDPSYNNLGNYTETIQIDYDPNQIAYRELLDVFWKSHNPTSRAISRQYMSIIFYHDEEQKRFALETRDREAADRNARIYTEIVPYTKFYLAEDYHQKYRLQLEQDLMAEFRRMFPHMADFINSTATARVNGYLAGHGTPRALEEEINSLGLSEAGVEKLRKIVGARES